MKISTFLLLLFLCIYNVSTAGIYLEFKFSYIPGKKSENQRESTAAVLSLGNRTMKAWYSDGNSRIESEAITPKSAVKNDVPPGYLDRLTKPTVMIYLKGEINKTYLIDESSKTYSIMEKPKTLATKEKKIEDFTITDLGKETVNGYSCNHLTIKEKGENSSIHFWISKEVKGVNEFKKMASNMQVKDGLYKALEAKNLDGMMVRMKSSAGEENGEIQMDLVKIEEITVLASKFSLSGYTLKENPFLNPMGSGAGEELSAEEKKMISDAVKGDASQIEFMENLVKKFPSQQRKMMIDQMIKSQKEKD
jgi:hypothetical protein